MPHILTILNWYANRMPHIVTLLIWYAENNSLQFNVTYLACQEECLIC